MDASEGTASCLPSDTFAHFHAREQQLLAVDAVLEQRKDSALLAATKASAAAIDYEYKPPVSEDTVPAVSSTAVAPTPVFSSFPPPSAAQASASGTSHGPNAPYVPPAPYPPQPYSSHIPASLVNNDSEAIHTTVRFQKARIVALQEELDIAVAKLTERERSGAELDRELKATAEENRKLQRGHQNSSVVTEKLRKQVGQLELKLEDSETQNRELKKQIETLSQSLKKSEADHKTKDARLLRVTDDMERYKASVKELKSTERDRQTGDRKETDRLLHEVRKLERQRTELLNGFKKQNQLIDVLKKQKVHLEAARMLAFTEEEYVRVMELGNVVN